MAHQRFGGDAEFRRMLSTGDFLEADAKMIAKLFNEGVRRRQSQEATEKVKEKKAISQTAWSNSDA